MTSLVAGRMAEAAARLIDFLDEAQRKIACRSFPDEAERRLWYYTPTDHGGLPLAAMGAVQQRNVHRLVATGLSTPGYNTVALIIGLDNILDRLEGWSVDFGRARGRDPQLYYVTIFGEPGGDAPWGWRFGGHHVSLHYTIIGGEVAASTPSFLGADPADSPLLGPHLHRPLAAAEDLGRELFRALGEPQRASALVAPVAPPDLVGGNRPQLTAGDRPPLLTEIWRRRFEGSLARRIEDMQAQLTATLGLEDAHLEAVSFTAAAQGHPGERARSRPELDPARAARLLSRPPARRARRPAGGARRPRVRSPQLPLGRQRRAPRAALLPDPGRAAAHRVRQQPARREPHPHRLARPRQRLRRRRAGPPLRRGAPLRPEGAARSTRRRAERAR